MSAHCSRFSLFKRSNGYYYILFDQEGRKRWKSTGARLKADALKALSNLQELLKTKPMSVTLGSFRPGVS